jgi:hypothetical protein
MSLNQRESVMPTIRFALRGTFLASFLVSPSIVLSQPAQIEPYDFKGVRLGASLDEFKTKYRTPGKTVLKGHEQVWQPDMACREEAEGITTCSPNAGTTITGRRASLVFLFAEGRLATIALGSSGWNFGSVHEAVSQRFGAPVSDVSGGAGRVVRWDNGVSIIELDELACARDASETFLGSAVARPRYWGAQIAAILEGRYGDCQVLEGQRGSITYVHKDLGANAVGLLRRAAEKAKNKARSDL